MKTNENTKIKFSFSNESGSGCDAIKASLIQFYYDNIKRRLVPRAHPLRVCLLLFHLLQFTFIIIFWIIMTFQVKRLSNSRQSPAIDEPELFVEFVSCTNIAAGFRMEKIPRDANFLYFFYSPQRRKVIISNFINYLWRHNRKK